MTVQTHYLASLHERLARSGPPAELRHAFFAGHITLAEYRAVALALAVRGERCTKGNG